MKVSGKVTLLLSLVLLTGSLAAEAQTGGIVMGTGVSSVTVPNNSSGLPYSAIRETETVQTLSDGTHIVTKSSTRTYRDSQGRTRSEFSPPAQLAAATGSQEPMQIIITD